MLTLLLALALASTNPLTHPDSKSSSRITVAGSQAQVELACQALSLLECVPIDRDGDLVLTPGELEAGRPAVERYLVEHYQLSTRAQPFDPAPATLVRLELDERREGAGEQRVRCALEVRLGEPGPRVSVRVRLFRERNPFHRDAAALVWNDEPAVGFLFAEGAEQWDFEPLAARRFSVLRAYIALGFDHIRSGWDHLAFLLGLLVVARSARSLIGVVTAFTVAHSVTLAAAALGWVSAPGRLVELAIALSIAYVGAEALLIRRPGARWVQAFGFGLIHGLGFAGFVGESLLSEPLKLTALAGFNLGVEFGQLAAVLAAALVLRWLPGERSFEGDARAWFAPRWLRLAGSLSVLLAGLYWFADRAGWL